MIKVSVMYPNKPGARFRLSGQRLELCGSLHMHEQFYSKRRSSAFM